MDSKARRGRGGEVGVVGGVGAGANEERRRGRLAAEVVRCRPSREIWPRLERSVRRACQFEREAERREAKG